MTAKEKIIETTIALIEERGERTDAITVREICERANVGLGLVNYYFGNKDKLIEVCVEKMINGVVERFTALGEDVSALTPFERLCYLGNMTFDFLFDHCAVSRISVLTDMQSPKANDNTHRTYAAYLPLVSACRPDWSEDRVRRATHYLITVMQQAFLRSDIIMLTQGVCLRDKEERRTYHRQVLEDLLGAAE